MPGNRPVTAAPSKRNADKASQERESVLAALNKEKIWYMSSCFHTEG